VNSLALRAAIRGKLALSGQAIARRAKISAKKGGRKKRDSHGQHVFDVSF
jgi:hypothetical protein